MLFCLFFLNDYYANNTTNVACVDGKFRFKEEMSCDSDYAFFDPNIP